MKRVFQLVKAEDGIRSEAFVLTREELAKALRNDGIPVTEADLVLCLGDVAEDGTFSFGEAPVMRVDTFIGYFGGSDVQVLSSTGS